MENGEEYQFSGVFFIIIHKRVLSVLLHINSSLFKQRRGNAGNLVILFLAKAEYNANRKVLSTFIKPEERKTEPNWDEELAKCSTCRLHLHILGDDTLAGPTNSSQSVISTYTIAMTQRDLATLRVTGQRSMKMLAKQNLENKMFCREQHASKN